MGVLRLIPPAQRQAWHDVLVRCGSYDVYHLPEYHLAVREVDQGEPLLLAYEHRQYVAALPILVRSVETVDGLSGTGCKDACSAYGYPGLLTNCPPDDPEAPAFREGWQAAISQVLQNLRVVAVFVRQHPLFPTGWMWQNLAAIKPLGQTVVLDLQRPESEQLRSIRHGHRYDLRRGMERGITVVEDAGLERLQEFRCLYEATMHAVNAESYYFFPRSYYEALRYHLQGRIKLLFAEWSGQPVAASMFFHCGKILQYHLSGGNPTMGQERAMGSKLIIDTVRRWGSANGFRWLHLGGGLGARQDSLFQFKAGFSDLRCQYEVVNYIVQPELYAELVRKRFGAPSADSCPTGWFPAYRQPVNRRAA